jgi:hypothetical protein
MRSWLRPEALRGRRTSSTAKIHPWRNPPNQVIGERAGIELTGLHAKLVVERDVDLILHYDEQTHTVEMEVFQLSS